MGSIRGVLTRFFMAITATRPGQWLLARLAHRVDRLVLKLTNGKQTLATLLTGLPVATLTTTGAKSGLLRSVQVVVIYAGGLPVVISSNWGQSKHPGWYYNLRANPQAELAINGAKQSYIARELVGEEREKYWSLAISLYPGFAVYRARASKRQIAVWVLEPVE